MELQNASTNGTGVRATTHYILNKQQYYRWGAGTLREMQQAARAVTQEVYYDPDGADLCRAEFSRAIEELCKGK